MIKLLKPGLTCFFVLALFGVLIAQTRTITGVVSDDKGNMLQGATVTVKNTQTAVITDVNGKFSISVPGNTQTLVISYVGMTPQEVAVEGKSTLIIELQSNGSQLNDVVVIGYGTMRRANVS